MITNLDKRECCGCGACEQRCPKQCITMIEDQEGFLYPQINMEHCINCGLCDKVCPVLKVRQERMPVKVLAAKNSNINDRIGSSSGGIFISLSKMILSRNGIVFGAVFDEKWEVKHTSGQIISEVLPMMGSKYMQSRIGNSYKHVEQYLKQGREVMFVGTPCQVAGLNEFLCRRYDNLLTVDVICHGVPSTGVWRKYLKERLSNNRLDDINNISFRHKKNGWNNYGFQICLSDDLTNENEIYEPRRDNAFIKGFLHDIYLRPSCYNCKFKSGRSQSDITLGDFWGISSIMPEFDDDLGISAFLLNNDKGIRYSNLLKEMEYRESSVDEIQLHNPAYCSIVKYNPRRERFYTQFLDGNKSVASLVSQFATDPPLIRFRNYLKVVIKRLVGTYNH